MWLFDWRRVVVVIVARKNQRGKGNDPSHRWGWSAKNWTVTVFYPQQRPLMLDELRPLMLDEYTYGYGSY